MKQKIMMSTDEYIDQLKMIYKNRFDLKENKKIAEKDIDLYAFAHIKNKKYFATKSIKIWEYANYEHCLVTKISNPEDNILPDKNFLDKTVDQLVELHRGHKQSYITLVKITNQNLDKSTIDKIAGFSYSKTFTFGFKGWCDLRLIIVDLKNNRVYTNQEGEKVKDNYLPERFIKEKTS